ncbi:MAG: hypothetical protein AVDCRST_MAG91-994 [uncultured Sphingomonadaceae bacterium]|uniref:Uncharacterized protein n=1 Tax=uncultured Sphingomonadaceae bacterium TaxID=169976 RepID=A0A6J4SNZ4_9SPHN|nr:MAG: hypothetical protein AVDCRST_MAG91-994 [uncultured Sphingomonadaceae bacterium]
MTDLLTIFAAVWGGSTLMIIGIVAAARASHRIRAHLLPVEGGDAGQAPASDARRSARPDGGSRS